MELDSRRYVFSALLNWVLPWETVVILNFSSHTGDTAVLECGSKMAGLAYWQCDLEGRWMTSTPDLSQCQSYWLQKLRGQLDKSADKQASIVHVAKDLAHFAASNGPLNPGDLLLLIDTVESMTARMEADLKTIPTIDQRRVVITQVVQVCNF